MRVAASIIDHALEDWYVGLDEEGGTSITYGAANMSE